MWNILLNKVYYLLHCEMTKILIRSDQCVVCGLLLSPTTKLVGS